MIMKNIIKISLIAVVFLVVSCNKEVIRPNNSSNEEVFVLKSKTNTTPDPTKPTAGPGITDPNNDPDLLIKKAVVIKQN